MQSGARECAIYLFLVGAPFRVPIRQRNAKPRMLPVSVSRGTRRYTLDTSRDTEGSPTEHKTGQPTGHRIAQTLHTICRTAPDRAAGQGTARHHNRTE